MHDKFELLNSIIANLNTAIQAVMAGQYIQACALIGEIGQQLAALKKGLRSDDESHRARVAALEKRFNDMIEEKRKAGELVGGEHVEIDLTNREEDDNGK